MLDVDGPYGWSRCDSHRDYFDILRRKKSFEGMTWAELGKGGSHHIDLKDLCKDAQNRLRALNLDDFDELYSLRITGKKRVWCFKDGRIMRVIWWDPDHQVCPVSKRHT